MKMKLLKMKFLVIIVFLSRIFTTPVVSKYPCERSPNAEPRERSQIKVCKKKTCEHLQTSANVVRGDTYERRGLYTLTLQTKNSN